MTSSTDLGSSARKRQSLWAFYCGCSAVTGGVALHLPMFMVARDMNYHLAGMPMDRGMMFGMGLIVCGLVVAAFGLLPVNFRVERPKVQDLAISAPEDAPLRPAHIGLMLILTLALIIDVMKPASLGFTIPGMIAEYGVPKATVSLVPFSALAGTVTGSILWGLAADMWGRKATILLSAIMFVGTSICGAMPSLDWNIAMCFLMGAAAGGMLPVTYALLAEMMPSRHRGWSLVLVGGLGSVGGYFAASEMSALFQPLFGWRILWLANLPTGLLLVLLGLGIPESARFLMAHGRSAEAERAMRRFGAVVECKTLPTPGAQLLQRRDPSWSWTGRLAALSAAGITWGLVNFGLLLWLPADLTTRGYSIGVASKLLTQSALIAFPLIFATAFLYGRCSAKGTLMGSLAVTALGLAGVLLLDLHSGASPVLPVAMLIVGSNALIATLLPFVAESFPLVVRGRATGWIAACTKGGGLMAQALSIGAIFPSMGTAALLILAPAAGSIALIGWLCGETRGVDLRSLEPLNPRGE